MQSRRVCRVEGGGRHSVSERTHSICGRSHLAEVVAVQSRGVCRVEGGGVAAE